MPWAGSRPGKWGQGDTLRLVWVPDRGSGPEETSCSTGQVNPRGAGARNAHLRTAAPFCFWVTGELREGPPSDP